MANYKKRRFFGLMTLFLIIIFIIIFNTQNIEKQWQDFAVYDVGLADFKPDNKSLELLEKLEVKGRAPKTGYEREKFSNGWGRINGCDLRNLILHRDLKSKKLSNNNCKIYSGLLKDLYSGREIRFKRGMKTSENVQIDHIVAVSDAWQKGAQQLTYEQRNDFYNDPENLIAVSKEENQQKGDSDAASWLPSNKSFRCSYVARQIKIKYKYNLWVTQAEKQAIKTQLEKCFAK